MNEYKYRIISNLIELRNPNYPKPEVDKLIKRIETDMNGLQAEIERLTGQLAKYEEKCEACGGDGLVDDIPASMRGDTDKTTSCPSCLGSGVKPVVRVPAEYLSNFNWYLPMNWREEKLLRIGNLKLTRSDDPDWWILKVVDE